MEAKIHHPRGMRELANTLAVTAASQQETVIFILVVTGDSAKYVECTVEPSAITNSLYFYESILVPMWQNLLKIPKIKL
jgi:hypothetical protein